MSIADMDLLAFGESLARGNSEIEWRTSVGRSYYAAYHRASDWHSKLPSQGMAQAGQGVHATLIACLTNPTVNGALKMRSMSVGYMLCHMKAARRKADYELGAHVDQAEAATTAASAQTMMDKAV